MSTYIKGGQKGSVSYEGQEVVKQHDMFCLRHLAKGTSIYSSRQTNLVPMKQGLTEQVIKQNDREVIEVIYLKTCPKCYQTVEEGRFIKDIK